MNKVFIRNPVEIIERTGMTPKRRQQVLDRAKGKCGFCNVAIAPGEPFDVDHRKPLAMGGLDTLPNLEPLHVACHKIKTAADINRIAKAKRQGRFHDGTRPKTKAPIRSRGFPKSRPEIDA